MIEYNLYKDNLIQVNTGDAGYLLEMKKYFTEHVDGYMFMPKYKAGIWDGTISVFKVNNRTFPVGLLQDAIKFHKIFFKNIPFQGLKVSDDIKKLFKGDTELIRDFNLLFDPNDRPYQIDSIEKLIKYRNCIAVVGTGGGKSNILTHIWKILNDSNIIQNVILVVPTINLVTQFKSDMMEYGLKEEDIGEVYGDIKQWDKKVVISTWQTLINNLDKLELFDAIFVDEVHQCRAVSLNVILQECSHMLYKIGCTGTLPNNRLENLNIRSYLGPVVVNYPVSYLIEKGYLSECNVSIYDIHYKKKIEGNFNEVKDEVFVKPTRLNVIKDIVTSVKDENILLLVGKIEKEGIVLENYLNSYPEFKDRQIKFIWGKTKPKEREEWRQKCIKEKNIILIAVFPLFQQGINIPTLNHIVLASSNKSKIRTLQSIGRSLRKTLAGQSYIYDIVDHSNKFLPKQSKERIEYYEVADFKINHIEILEN